MLSRLARAAAEFEGGDLERTAEARLKPRPRGPRGFILGGLRCRCRCWKLEKLPIDGELGTMGIPVLDTWGVVT